MLACCKNETQTISLSLSLAISEAAANSFQIQKPVAESEPVAEDAQLENSGRAQA